MLAISHTNVLSIPLARAIIDVSTNENWIDSFAYYAGTDDTFPPLDLRGISFQLMARRSPTDPEVIVWAQSSDGTLQVGPTPDFNYLVINVSLEVMKTRAPGVYVADMIAFDGTYQRKIMEIALTIDEGIAR
jgi:hypothetical protein